MDRLASDRPRLLFVVSNDYGELSNALDLIQGQAFEATILLPPRLAAANLGRLAVPSAEYRSPADIIEAVDRDRPDVVFLFSAYLYGVNNLFRPEETASLIRALQARGVAVATSDPFLGLMTHPSPATFAPGHPLGPALAEHFAGLSGSLASLIHLYFMPADDLPVEHKVWSANPDPRWGSHHAGDSRWLFLLSAEDFGHQEAAMGRTAFTALLLDLVRATTQQGHRPVVLGPPACIEALAGVAAGVEGLELRTFLGHDDFRTLLLGANRVVYWNVFSNSILARVAGRRAVTFFAKGHMAHAIPPLFEAGMRHYYPGGGPPILDPRSPLDAGSLARADEAWRAARDVAIARYSGMPSPSEMVEAILDQRPSAS